MAVLTSRWLLHAVHVWAWGLYFGTLLYTYLRLFPDMQRYFASDDRFEEFSITTGDGLRWKIYGALILAGATGLALIALERDAWQNGAWRTLVAVKCVLLLATLGVYTHVSYIMWPRRVFVAVGDRDAERRRFFRMAVLLLALLIAQVFLGAAAHLML